MSVDKFIKAVHDKAQKNGIKVLLEDTKLVYAKDESVGCAGYFDVENKILSVATKMPKKSWLGLLAHESSHLDQWVEERYMWNKLSHGYDLFFDWLSNKKIVKREHLIESVQDIIRLERDCEIRSVKKIEKYNLPINITVYKKRANSYLYAYLFFLENKVWIPKIYDSKDVWDNAPQKFPKEYNKIPIKLLRKFEQALINYKK